MDPVVTFNSRFYTSKALKPGPQGYFNFFHGPLSWALNLSCSWIFNFSFNTKPSMTFVLLINIKMPTNVNILILVFVARTNIMLRWVEHGKSFIISGPENWQIRNWLQVCLSWALLKTGNNFLFMSIKFKKCTQMLIKHIPSFQQ